MIFAQKINKIPEFLPEKCQITIICIIDVMLNIYYYECNE